MSSEPKTCLKMSVCIYVVVVVWVQSLRKMLLNLLFQIGYRIVFKGSRVKIPALFGPRFLQLSIPIATLDISYYRFKKPLA